MTHIQNKEVCLCRTGKAKSAQISSSCMSCIFLICVYIFRSILVWDSSLHWERCDFYKTTGRQTINRKVVITLSRKKKKILSCCVSLYKLGGRRASRLQMKWLPFSSPVAHVYESLIHAGGSNTETESIILRLKWTWNYCRTIWPRRLENQSGVGNGWIHSAGSFVLLYSWTLAVPGTFSSTSQNISLLHRLLFVPVRLAVLLHHLVFVTL